MRIAEILWRLATGVILSLLLCLPRTASAEDPIRFADVNLKAGVEAALGKSNPTPTDMLALTRLNAYRLGVTDLAGLEYATNLTWLKLEDNQVSDISPLAGLTNLTSLDLWGNQVSNISSLAGLTNLTLLSLWGNHISDISPLAGLTDLTWLSLGENPIGNISSLAALTNLTTLYVGNSQISSISPLARLTNLTILDLAGNQISDISLLAGRTNLRELYLQGNPLNAQACATYIPQILANNRGMTLHYDPCVDRCTLMISSSAGGSVTDPGEGTFDYDPGTVVPVEALAQTGWHFSQWTGTAVDAGKAANPALTSTTVTADADYTLQAVFVANQHTLTITCGEGGTVSTDVVSTSGSARTLTGPGSFVLDHGAELKVSVTANADWKFTMWTGTMASNQSVLTFTLMRDERLEAHFALDPRTLVVSCGEGGTVVTPGVGSFAFERGTAVPVEAAPNPGYRFVRWTGTVVDRKDIADARLSQTSVVLNDGGTLIANFEAVRGFDESWETAAGGYYEPVRAKFIHADEGAWMVEDAISGSCGRTPQKAQVLTLDSGQALLLTSTDSNSTCSDIVSLSLTESGLVNPGFALPVDANTTISFYEVGQLDHPGLHGTGQDCAIPPCFDNVSLLLSDNKGNVLAYVLQRHPDVVADTSNTNVSPTYREIFLDPTGIYYQRNLAGDLRTIPAFDPTGAEIRSIEFRVDAHGWAVLDDLIITPGTINGIVPVYHFWSPVLESDFFTVGADEKQTLIDLFPGIWTFEGIGYLTLGDGSNAGAAPVYRFWSPVLLTHFYTISEAERDTLLRDFQSIWMLEGTAFYAYPEGRQPANTYPVYRLWSGALGRHVYTTDERERDNLISTLPDVWTFEGVAWYAYPPQWDSSGALGVMRDNSAATSGQ